MSLDTKLNMPLCKFGPGGDFRWDYTPQIDNNRQGVFAPVAEAVKFVIKSISYRLPVCSGENEIVQEQHSFERQNREFNTGKIRDTENIPSLSEQQAIFSDNARVVRAASKEPRHRVRALRRTPRKRFTVCLSGQSPLFETH